jgi:uncharacterized protein (TIGR02266 family)
MADTPSVTAADARKHARYKVTIPVDCSTRDMFFSNHVCNISKGGLFIRSESPLPLNAEVILVLCLSESNECIRATGRVAWNYDIEKRTSQIVPGSGIHIVNMSTADRATLEDYLAGLTAVVSPPPTPH